MRFLMLLSLLCLAACGLVGGGTPDLDFNQLRGGMSLEEARALLPRRTLECRVPNSGVGMSRCEATLTDLGDMKASRIKYYFRDGKLISVTVAYTPDAYEALVKKLDGKYERHPQQEAGSVAWKVSDGVVATSSTDLDDGNVVAIWASAAEFAAAQQGG